MKVIKDITKTIRWRNTKNKIRRSRSYPDMLLISDLLAYMEMLEEQIMELNEEVSKMKSGGVSSTESEDGVSDDMEKKCEKGK